MRTWIRSPTPRSLSSAVVWSMSDLAGAARCRAVLQDVRVQRRAAQPGAAEGGRAGGLDDLAVGVTIWAKPLVSPTAVLTPSTLRTGSTTDDGTGARDWALSPPSATLTSNADLPRTPTSVPE